MVANDVLVSPQVPLDVALVRLIVAPPAQTTDVPIIGATVGNGSIFTVTVVVLLQVGAEYPVMVYVVAAAGFAVTMSPVVADKPIAGDHEYVPVVPAPVAVILTPAPPAQ